MAQHYRVVISGRTSTGRPLSELRAAVAQAFGLQGEQLDRMLSGKPTVVSRRASGAAAEQLLARLRELGLEAYSEPLAETAPVAPPAAATEAGTELFALADPPTERKAQAASPAAAPTPPAEAEMICPKCGTPQPKRTLCRQCGLDMPRYLAAQATAELEARERRETERAAARGAPRTADGGMAADAHSSAALLGLGLTGRLGRLDYFAGSLLSTLLWFAFVLLAAGTGKTAFVGLGLLLSGLYGLRCVALRLHDTGRTGWLALVALVPLLGGLMALALLFVGGEDDDNEYGEPPRPGGGRRACATLLVLLASAGLSYRSVGQNPEKAMRVLEAMQAYQGKAAPQDDDADEAADGPPAAVHYASNNRVDIYVIAGCTDCDAMRRWLDGNGLRYTLYSVDSDQGAAERLHSIIAGDGQGRVQLPVLEVNGKVLPGNPAVGDVHRQLRQASSS